jgi:predicted RecA/RadA family phage recombinase
MATNLIMQPAEVFSVVCSSPTAPVSGDPVRYGYLTGVALTDEGEGGNIATETSVDFSQGIWDLSCKGVDADGNSAIAVGDAIFYVDADTPKLSKKVAGYFFGIALETVGAGSTDTIHVLHMPAPGSGALATSGVTTTKIADAAVTAAKLTTTMQKGTIHIPITGLREVSSNAVQNLAAHGGILASDSTPTLARVNGATDKQLRVGWAASNVDELTAQFVYPPDLDDTATLTVNILAAMAGASDTPVMAIGYFEGVGDTNAGGNTAAITGTTVAKYSVTIAAADVGAYPQPVSISLVPAAHGTDICYLYGCWIEYTRK